MILSVHLLSSDNEVFNCRKGDFKKMSLGNPYFIKILF